MKKQLISEVDVLYATSIWLIKNDWRLDKISFPKGQEIKLNDQLQFFKDTWKADSLVIPPTLTFPTNGPDIIATKGIIKWKIECKGYGRGVSSTLRNNFDRALSSCVSYFDDGANVKLGLALPDYYKIDIQKRAPIALRMALKMSIFLYNTTTHVVDYFEPDNRLL
jgi:hypothetical protein